jgi:hypothetical protein
VSIAKKEERKKERKKEKIDPIYIFCLDWLGGQINLGEPSVDFISRSDS